MDSWDVYYAGLCAMALHPGYLKGPELPPTFEQCAEMATDMVAARIRHKYPRQEGKSCLG